MAPSETSDESEEEVVVTKHIASPTSAPLRERVLNRTLTMGAFGDSSFSSSAPSSSRRNALAKKKEEQEAEEYRMNQRLIEAGMDPGESTTADKKKIIAMLDEAEEERKRAEVEKKRFAREAGLCEDEFQHLVEGRRSSEDDTQEQQQQRASQDKRGSQGQTASQPHRSNSGQRQSGLLAEAGDNQDRSQSPLKRGGSQQKSDSQSTKSVDGDEYQIDEVQSDDDDEIQPTPKHKSVRKLVSDTDDDNVPMAQKNSSTPPPKKVRRVASDDDDDDFIQTRRPLRRKNNSGAPHPKASAAPISSTADVGFDNIAFQYQSDFAQSNPTTYQIFKTKNKRPQEAQDDNNNDGDKEAVTEEKETGARPRRRLNRLGPASSNGGASQTITSFLRVAYDKADRVNASTSRSSPIPENDSETTDGSKRKFTSKDIKKLLADEEKMKGFDAFRTKYLELKRTAVRSDLKGETFTIHQTSKNVVFIPGTLIVDEEATKNREEEDRESAKRRQQGGVQPLRSCRAAKLQDAKTGAGDSSQKGKSGVILLDEDSQDIQEVVEEKQTCPVCDKQFPAKAIERHVDKCIEKSQTGSVDAGEGGSERNTRPRRTVIEEPEDFLQR